MAELTPDQWFAAKRQRLFDAAEIESQLVDLGETLPEDYQDAPEVWKVVDAFLEWLKSETQKRAEV